MAFLKTYYFRRKHTDHFRNVKFRKICPCNDGPLGGTISSQLHDWTLSLEIPTPEQCFDRSIIVHLVVASANSCQKVLWQEHYSILKNLEKKLKSIRLFPLHLHMPCAYAMHTPYPYVWHAKEVRTHGLKIGDQRSKSQKSRVKKIKNWNRVILDASFKIAYVHSAQVWLAILALKNIFFI